MTHFAIKDTEYILSAPTVGLLPESKIPEVAFVGRSNVGKSSLLNFLTARRSMAHVSRTPGRTRALNCFKATILCKDEQGQKEEKHFCLIDLPGFGYARMSHVEKARLSEVLSEYLDSHRKICAVFHLFDCRREPNDEDLHLSKMLRQSPGAYITVITKIDQVSASKRIPLQKHFVQVLGIAEQDCLITSASENMGRNAILSILWKTLR